MATSKGKFGRVFIRVDPSDEAAIRDELRDIRNGAERVMVDSINAVIKADRKHLKKDLARRMNISERHMQKQGRGVHAKLATQRSLTGSIHVGAKRIPLIYFRATKQTRQGVTYDVGRGRKLIKSAFFATMSNRKRGVFKRRRAGGDKLVPRLPIDQRFGPSPSMVFNREIGRAIFAADAADRIRDGVLDRVDAELAKHR